MPIRADWFSVFYSIIVNVIVNVIVIAVVNVLVLVLVLVLVPGYSTPAASTGSSNRHPSAPVHLSVDDPRVVSRVPTSTW